MDKPKMLLDVTTDDNKYTIIQHLDGQLSMLRNGHPWIESVELYAKVILTLAQDLEETRKDFKHAKDEVDRLTRGT